MSWSQRWLRCSNDLLGAGGHRANESGGGSMRRLKPLVIWNFPESALCNRALSPCDCISSIAAYANTMRSVETLYPRLGGLTLATGLLLLVAGCSTPKIDWNARIGNYSYDQVVLELGPPDKEAKLTDGTIVADWLTRRGYRYPYPVGGYYGYCAPGYYGPPYPTYVNAYAPDYFLRLTFAPDGRLQSWKKYMR